MVDAVRDDFCFPESKVTWYNDSKFNPYTVCVMTFDNYNLKVLLTFRITCTLECPRFQKRHSGKDGNYSKLTSKCYTLLKVSYYVKTNSEVTSCVYKYFYSIIFNTPQSASITVHPLENYLKLSLSCSKELLSSGPHLQTQKHPFFLKEPITFTYRLSDGFSIAIKQLIVHYQSLFNSKALN